MDSSSIPSTFSSDISSSVSSHAGSQVDQGGAEGGGVGLEREASEEIVFVKEVVSLSGDEEDELEVVRADPTAARTLPKAWSGDFTASLPSRPWRKKRQRPFKLRTAVEIPEIRDLVISFVLAAPSINTALLRVSWSFYRTFAPHLYETVDLSYSKSLFYSFIQCLESRERLSAPPIMALKLSVPGSEFLWDNMFKRLKECLARARPSRFIPVSLSDLHLKFDCCRVDLDALAGIAWLIFNCKVLSDIFISGDDHGNMVGKLLGHFIQPSSPYFMEDRLKTMGFHCGASGYVNGEFGPSVFGTWHLDFEDVYDDGWISKSLIGDCLLVLCNNSRDMFRASVLDLTLGFVAFVSRCSASEKKKWALVQKVVEEEEEEEEEDGSAPPRVIFPPELDLLPLIQKELDQRGLQAMLSDLESDEESGDEESEEEAEEDSGEGGSDDEWDA